MTKTQIANLKRRMAIPIHPLWIGIIRGLLAGATINAIAAFRSSLAGTAAKRAGRLWLLAVVGNHRDYLGYLARSDFCPEHPLIGILMMTVFTMLLAPI